MQINDQRCQNNCKHSTASALSLTALEAATIYAGNIYSLSVAVASSNVPLTDPTADVRAAIVSPRLDANLSGTIALTFNGATQQWEGTFTGAQTRRLLTTPDDLTSGLLYSKPKIEVEVVGTGYTRHYQVTASPSLISDGPMAPPPADTDYVTSDEFEALQADVVGLTDDVLEIRSQIPPAPIEINFTDADLSVAGALPIVHGLNAYPRNPAVWTEENELIGPDDIDYVSANAIVIYLQSYRPIPGTWRAVV